MKRKGIRLGSIRKMAKEHKYFAVRESVWNFEIGVNSKTVFMGRQATMPNNHETKFIGMRAISFMEYISIKSSFIS